LPHLPLNRGKLTVFLSFIASEITDRKISLELVSSVQDLCSFDSEEWATKELRKVTKNHTSQANSTAACVWKGKRRIITRIAILQAVCYFALFTLLSFSVLHFPFLYFGRPILNLVAIAKDDNHRPYSVFRKEQRHMRRPLCKFNTIAGGEKPANVQSLLYSQEPAARNRDSFCDLR